MKFQSRYGGALRAGLILLAFLAVFVLGDVCARAAGPPAGIAPVDPPFGGFAIDGNLCANTPAANSGDWLCVSNFPGTGGSVLGSTGVPLNPQATFHFVDAYNGKDIVFAGGQKWFGDPNTWIWTLNKASSKTDINNVLVHITKDIDAHTWLVIAADRYSTSGDSYIDFEFLQNVLTRNSNGTFTSAGPHGGRTVGDLLLSLAFTGGGSIPDFLAFRWQTNSAGGYAYVDVTPSLPVGRVFAAINTNTIPVPYGAFGLTTYAPNAFAEAALDLTGLLGNFDECLSIGFKTIMVKTKASPSDTATLGDLIDPIQYPFRIGPSADAGPDQTRCTEGTSTVFPLQGAATAGTKPIASTMWTVVSGTATIDSPTSLITTAQVFSATATLRLTALQTNGCTESDDIVLTVSPLPICSITGTNLVCPRGSTQFRAPAGMSSYNWSIVGNGSISGASTQQTVTVTSGSACSQEFTLTLNVISNKCSSTCTSTVMVNDTTAPTITCPADKVLECPADTRTNVTGVATAQDGCGIASISYTDAVSNNCGGTRIISRTWTALDFCGNSNSCVQTITVRDTIKPTIVCPTNRIVECGADISPTATGTATAQDGCGQVTIIYADAVSNKCGGTKIISRTWTAIDDCGNSSSCVQTITVQDTTKPTIQCPANRVLECGEDTSTNSTGMATAQDVCGSVTIRYTDSVTNKCGLTKVITRTWTATDECGNASSCVQTITVVDTTKPIIACPPDQVLECGASTATNVTGIATAQDVCGSVTIRYSDVVSNKCGLTKVILRTWTATDQCSNTTSCVQTITVVDTTKPTIQCPPDRVVECGASTATNVMGIATAQDTCGSVSVAYTDVVSNKCGLTKVISRTWTATDQCGNTSSCLQTITVQDTTRPTIQCPTNKVVECGADTRTNATGVATAQDICGQIFITYSDSVSNNCGGTKVISRTWTAVDDCGNSSSCVQTITVQDTTVPTIQCPPNRVVECGDSTATNVMGVATAQDICGQVAITYSDAISNKCGLTKVISRTWTATDECGNKSTCVQTITVQDTTKPTIQCPADQVLECGASTATNVTGIATAQDVCGQVTIRYSDVVSNKCGLTKVITRTWTATDECGNASSCVQTITVVDTTKPTIQCPADRVVECGSSTATNATGVATAQDICGSVSVAYADVVSNKCGLTKVILRTWTATDACGNTSSCVQTITVVDTTKPTIQCPTNRTVECGSDTRTNAMGVATAQDVCGQVFITYSDSISNNCGGTKVISRTWTAVDECGNSSSCVQTITVQDTTIPTIQCPPNRVVECGDSTATNVMGVATAQDICGQVAITYSDSISNKCGLTKVILRTWTATDECGNKGTCVQTITVQDTTKPTIQCPPDRLLDCPANTTTNVTGVATAQDVCGQVTTTYSDSVTNKCTGTKIILRTWTATDQCGNSSSCVQTITVQDITKPILTIPTDRVLQCPGDTRTNVTGVATATDTCSPATVRYSDVVTARCGGTKVIARTWTATDECGNATSGVQTITVEDTTPPTITCPPNQTMQCPADTRTNVTGVATASDACGGVVITYSDGTQNNCGGTKVITRTWTATDDCGNRQTCVQTITVVDSIKPTISVPADQILECGGSTAPSATGTATGQDGCSQVTITYSDSVVNACGGSRVITRTWTVADACGNSTNKTQILTVRDTTPPSLRLPSNLVLPCPGDTRTNVTGVPVVTDVCGSYTLTYSDVVSNSCATTRTVWRTWTAVDACGNSTNGLQTIAVVDTTKPTITCPTINVQCVDDLPAPYADLPAFLAGGGRATDSCSPTLTFALISDSGIVGRCPGRVTRVYRVTDVCGNFGDCTQTITVDDTIAPVLTCPTNRIVECGLSLDPSNTGQAKATDNCSTNVVITYTDALVPSEYTVNFYAADTDLNTGPYSPTYLRLAPASLPRPVGRALDPLRNAVAYAPSGQLDALTSLGGEPMALGQVIPFEAVIELSGSPGPERGTIEFTVDWATHTTSNDRFGFDTNYMVYCAFVDAADPGSIDPNLNAKVDSFSSRMVNQGTIDEQIEGTFRVSGLDIGDRVVVEIWMVFDSRMPDHVGGTIAAQLVSAQKALTPPEPITVGSKTISIGNLNKCVPLPTAQPQPPLGPLPPQPPILPGATVSVINRTWAATDDCGNRSSCVQQFTVRDTAPPLLNAPNMVLECPADTRTNFTGIASAPDACGGQVVLTYSDSVVTGCAGTKVVTRTWAASDESGNMTNVVQTITVRDSTPPALTAPPSVVLECPVTDTSVNALGAATAQDICGSATVSYSDVVTPVCGATKVIARTWTAIDTCGNATNIVQTITVQDTKAPTISCQPARSVNAGDPWSFDQPAASDTCSAVTLRILDTTTNFVTQTSCLATRTWQALDACGNSATCQQNITILNAVAPALQIRCPDPTHIELSWIAPSTGFQLEVSDSSFSTPWTAVPVTPTVINGMNVVVLPASSPQKFYRLHKVP